MKYIKYIVLVTFIVILNCSVKKPVENEREEIEVGPGEKVLLKDRDQFAELFVYNKTGAEYTFYIEAIGDVWGYEGSFPNIGDSLSVGYITEGQTTMYDTGFDHISTDYPPYHGVPFSYSIYKVGISGTNKWMRISWLDDRYYHDSEYYRNYSFDTWAVYDGNLKIGWVPPGESYTEENSEGKTYHIWKYLRGDTQTSISSFEGNLSEVTGASISGPDSLGTNQSGNFTSTRAPGGRELQFLEYKWEVKKVNDSYKTLEDWTLLDSTTSYSANIDFTLKSYIWDLVHDVTVTDTHLVKVDPTEISSVNLDGPTSLEQEQEGEFSAEVTPEYRATYDWYIDYDWSVMYIDEPPKKREINEEEKLRLPPTGEWIDLDYWDGYQTIDFSSSYYSFRLKVIVTDEYYSSTKYDTLDVVVTDKK